VTIVYQHIAAKSTSRVVINTACAVCDIAHDQRVGARTELSEDIGDDGCEEEESFWELERDICGAGGAYTVDSLVDFEVVVPREMCNGGIDVGVVEDFGGDLIKRARRSNRLWR